MFTFFFWRGLKHDLQGPVATRRDEATRLIFELLEQGWQVKLRMRGERDFLVEVDTFNFQQR